MNRITLLFYLLITLVSCNPGNKTSDKLVVSVSVLPQKYFIEQIAGDMIEVNVMIPPGSSPATYEPSVSQLSKIVHSPTYMRIGYVGFELSWMEKIKAVNPEMKIVDLSVGIDLIKEEEQKVIGEQKHLHGEAHGGIDPHIWLSSNNSKIIARNTYKELIQLLPDEKDQLNEKYIELLSKIDSIQESIINLLSTQEDRSFIIYHPALSYFARDYNLIQYSLEIGGKTPSPAHMKWMIDLAREKKISTIFLQKQFDQKNAEVLAKAIGAKVVLINPLDPDWESQMFNIANQLSSSL